MSSRPSGPDPSHAGKLDTGTARASRRRQTPGSAKVADAAGPASPVKVDRSLRALGQGVDDGPTNDQESFDENALSETLSAVGDGAIPAFRDWLEREGSSHLIARVTLLRAMPPAMLADLKAGSCVAVVEVPSLEWGAPIEVAVRRLANCPMTVVLAVTKPKAGGKDDSEILEQIARGHSVVGVVTNTDYLSPVLMAAADHRITLTPPTADLVSEFVRLWCREDAGPRLVASDIAGLDIMDLAAALRPDRTVDRCAERLRRASRSRLGQTVSEYIPPLESLRGYGEVHDWALGLVADIEQVRAGKLPASSLDAAVLFGPPGTGKTTLAKSIAASAGVPFRFSSVGAWFSSSPGYLDSIVKQIDAFADELLMGARKSGAGTAIGFLDELDALPNRDQLSPRNADYWLPIITHCLVRWEALRRAGIVLLGATNNLVRVDPALLRPGRFDRSVFIGPPDETGRVDILRSHLGRDLPHADLSAAARLCPGATGAVLAGYVKSARARARRTGRPLSLDDLIRIIVPEDQRSEDELWAVAIHEAGHAVAARNLGLKVTGITIQSAGSIAGATNIHLPSTAPDRAGLERQVIALLAGRAADKLLGDGPDSGATSDLREATRLLAATHACFGLGDSLAVRGPSDQAELLIREDRSLARLVEADLRRCMQAAERLVAGREADVLAVAEALVERRVLSEDEVASLTIELSPARERPARIAKPAGARTSSKGGAEP